MDRSGMPLQIETQRTLVRQATYEDLHGFEAWPSYPAPCENLSMGADASRASDGRFWWQQIDEPNRCHYSVLLRDTGELIGVLAYCRINWAEARIGNMGTRIRPDLCGMGLGTESLGALLDETLRSGINVVRLDVAAPNQRAVRSYHRCRMAVVGEFWEEGVGPDNPEGPPCRLAAHVLQHFRKEQDRWMVRFYWMERASLQNR